MFRLLDSNTHGLAGVYSRVGVDFLPWMGFIDATHLGTLGGDVVPVRLSIDGYRLLGSNEWVEVKHPEYIQGCVFRHHRVVFGVMDNWKPKIVSKPCILDGAHARKY